MKTRKKTFYLLSGVLGISIALYVWIYSQLDYQRVVEEFKNNAYQAERSFRVAREQTYRQLQQLATFLAGDEKHQQLLLLGKHAVTLEGNNGELTVQVRHELYDHLRKNEILLLRQSDFHQVQFHLAPALSFLRISKPEKFGEQLGDIRFTVVTANQEHRIVTGFEVGETVAALRGVAPVDAFDGTLKKKIHVGSVEIATSFQKILDPLHHQLPWLNSAVLLDQKVLQKVMCPEKLTQLKQTHPFGNGYIVDTTTSSQISSLLHQAGSGLQLLKDGNHLFRLGEQTLNLLSLPLRDFRGEMNPDLPDIGRIILWEDVGAELNAYHQRLLRLIFYGVLLFFNLEVIMYIAIHKMTQSLRKELEKVREEEELSEKARAIAEESLRIKNEFIGTMSHELRTPLNAMIGLGQLLSETSLSAKQHTFMEKINVSAHRLLTIIDEILLISTLDQSQLKTQPQETFNPCQLLKKVADGVAQQAMTAQVTVQVECAADVPRRVTGYAASLEQALLQLMGNGIKFGNGNDVTLAVAVVSAAEKMVTLEFSVTDHGVGIAPEEQARIFEPFQQGDSSASRKYNGTGLGLTIAAKIVHQLGDKITVTSTLGEGSCFSFQLPVTVDQANGEAEDKEIEISPTVSRSPAPLLLDNSARIAELLNQLEQPLAEMKPQPSLKIVGELKKGQCPGPWCDEIATLVQLVEQYQFSAAQQRLARVKAMLAKEESSV